VVVEKQLRKIEAELKKPAPNYRRILEWEKEIADWQKQIIPNLPDDDEEEEKTMKGKVSTGEQGTINFNTLRMMLSETSEYAERFLKVSKEFNQATDEDEALDLMADVEVAASILGLKMDSIRSEIEEITDNLPDDDEGEEEHEESLVGAHEN
jgi:Tfp pilus assembly protein PilO